MHEIKALFGGLFFIDACYICHQLQAELVISFLLASILLTLSPGPDNIYVLTQSINKGYKVGLAISIGLCSGLIIHTSAAALGVSVILKQSDIAFNILKYLGAGYLGYLAIMAAKEKTEKQEIEANSNLSTKSWLSLIRKGFLMNVLNPKVSLFFLALLPQFVSKNGMHFSKQMLVLGLIFMLQAMVIFSSISVLASKLSNTLDSPLFWKISKWISVLVLAFIAIGLLFA